jgi:hypothetical protein
VAFFGALFLILFLLLRPMDVWPAVAGLHSLETLSVITAVGVGWEMRAAHRGSAASPQLWWLGGFFLWAYAVSVARLGLDRGMTAGWGITLGPFFMLILIFALRSIERLRALMVILLASLAFVSAVAIHQAQQPRECIELRTDPSSPDADPELVPDGRECLGPRICEREGGVEGSDYLCERVGLLGTTSTQGRVRWRGQLEDPNELAVIIGALVPFLFMFGVKGTNVVDGEDVTRGPKRTLTVLLLGVLLFVGLWAVVLTQSRGGQLVLGAAVVTMLVRRYGWWAIVVAVAMTAPVVALSWRSGADAESSSFERAEILSEGLQLLKTHPILGIGVSQFAKENPMNMAAHNSYLLIATELGIPGLLIWCGLVWTTIKIPVSIALRPPVGIDPRLVRFAEALASSTIALHVGIFFLSFVYKTIFWVWLSLAGALYLAVRQDHPEFELHPTRRDLAGICVLAVVALIAVRIAAMSAR